MMRTRRNVLIALAGFVAVLAAAAWFYWQAGAPERQYRENARITLELCLDQPTNDPAACLADYRLTLEAWPPGK